MLTELLKKWFKTHIGCFFAEYLEEYRRFDRAHASGPKVTSGLCLYIGPATNTVKVMSNEAGLRLLYYGMCFTYIHLFVATRHDINTFPKGCVE